MQQLRPLLPVGVGGIALITSSLSNATAGGSNDWHAVAILRKGDTLWIFDPAFAPADYASITPPLRLSRIRGTRVVQALLLAIRAAGAAIQHCFIQGIGDQSQSCMPRSVQWIEGVLDGSNPDAFVPGVIPDAATWVSIGLQGIS